MHPGCVVHPRKTRQKPRSRYSHVGVPGGTRCSWRMPAAEWWKTGSCFPAAEGLVPTWTSALLRSAVAAAAVAAGQHLQERLEETFEVRAAACCINREWTICRVVAVAMAECCSCQCMSKAELELPELVDFVFERASSVDLVATAAVVVVVVVVVVVMVGTAIAETGQSAVTALRSFVVVAMGKLQRSR